MVALAAPIPASASAPTPTTASPLPPAGSIGLRLIDAPVTSGNDPRALIYIVDHLAPGTVIHRRVEVSNTATSTTRVSLYSAAATIAHGSFLGAAGHTANDLSSWTSVSPGAYDVLAGGRTTATVTISVPADAAPGEQYGVVWAEAGTVPIAGGGIAQVSRVGIRLYVSVGPGGPPAADFTIESLTAARSPGGHPVVVASVHNTGGRALDMSGSLQLLAGPGGLRAGPFPATLGTTLAIGDTEAVAVTLDRAVPAGPWDALITLHSGLLERSAHASITFPDTGVTPLVIATSTRRERVSSAVLAFIVLLLLALTILVTVVRRRRRRRVADIAANRTHRRDHGPGVAPARAKAAASAARSSTRDVQGRRWSIVAETVGMTVTLLLAGLVSSSSQAHAAAAVVPLGAAESYSVLSATVATNTGATTHLTGDLGADSIVGYTPGNVGGQTRLGIDTDPGLADLDLAYNDAAGRTTPNASFSGDLNGRVFGPGVYRTDAALELTGTLTLDGGGDPDAVFIFQVGAALNTAASSRVSLIGGAQAANVFWQVVGAAGIGALAWFSGTIMAKGAITVGDGADLTGRALSFAAVTLASNIVTTQAATGGTLAITVPAGPVDLGTFAHAASVHTISGSLGPVNVDDTRGASAVTGWVVSVSATDFTSPSGPSIAASSIGYSAGSITQIRGTATYTDSSPGDLSVASPAVSATASGDNASATWNPTIFVIVPAGAVAGVYTSSITHSVV